MSSDGAFESGSAKSRRNGAAGGGGSLPDLVVRYQACDDSVCLAPQEVRLEAGP